MQIAVLADVHGNLPALRAVLAQLDREPVDAIVVAGDMCGGPLVRDALDLIQARPEPVHWIAGNSERVTVTVFDGGEIPDGRAGRAAAWSSGRLDRRWRDAIAGWPIAVTLDGVRFCHGSPRRDDEILTRGTPDAALAEALADVSQSLVVGGHTHQQMIRRVHEGLIYANAGSVGLPYEGSVNAFWMLVADGAPRLRKTSYDQVAALTELRASGFPELEKHLDGSLVSPVDPDWVTAFFEHTAGRRQHPGEPRPAG
jgi:predicted phosphodiesterase